MLQAAFTGPIARGLSLIAIVVGGLMFAFGEGGSKKALAGIVFGVGMAMGAANFMAWLFFKILANLQENRTSDRCPQKAEARSQRLPRSYL